MKPGASTSYLHKSVVVNVSATILGFPGIAYGQGPSASRAEWAWLIDRFDLSSDDSICRSLTFNRNLATRVCASREKDCPIHVFGSASIHILRN